MAAAGTVLRQIHPFHRIGNRQFRKDQRHQDALQKARGQLPGRIGKHRHRMLFELVPRPRETARLMNRVSVGEDQQLTPRSLRACPAGIRLASKCRLPADLECWSFEQRHTRAFAGNAERLVGRGVVDHDQLPFLAQLPTQLRLSNQRFQAGSQGRLLVACRNDDGQNQRRRFGQIYGDVPSFIHDFVL